jgi:hypothetical protein
VAGLSNGRTIWIADVHRGDSSFYGVLLLIFLVDAASAFLAKRLLGQVFA